MAEVTASATSDALRLVDDRVNLRLPRGATQTTSQFRGARFGRQLLNMCN
jgi:hypothetical protein